LPKYMAHAKNPLMQKVGVQGLAVGHIHRYPCICTYMSWAFLRILQLEWNYYICLNFSK
jgi:hypothetical protein